MKRSNEPIFWSMFGAGGMLAALFGPMLVFITGVAVPLGIVVPQDLMSYPHMLALAQNWLGKICIFVVVALFLWHAAHRIHLTLHDLGMHASTGTRVVVYGLAFLGTLVAAWALLALGF
jgi:fumarate reductase subunit D